MVDDLKWCVSCGEINPDCSHPLVNMGWVDALRKPESNQGLQEDTTDD